MVSIFFFFWLLVILFGVIGAMRGWAKEILVSFSVILALFMITLIQSYVPVIATLVQSADPETKKYLFIVQTIVVVVLAFFGYQTPTLQRFVGSEKFRRERLQDALLGFFLGSLNGFLVVGTIWFYMHQANYPYPDWVSAPNVEPLKSSVERFLVYLPPRWLGIPGIYFAVAAAFVFVLIVFI